MTLLQEMALLIGTNGKLCLQRSIVIACMQLALSQVACRHWAPSSCCLASSFWCPIGKLIQFLPAPQAVEFQCGSATSVPGLLILVIGIVIYYDKLSTSLFLGWQNCSPFSQSVLLPMKTGLSFYFIVTEVKHIL